MDYGDGNHYTDRPDCIWLVGHRSACGHRPYASSVCEMTSASEALYKCCMPFPLPYWTYCATSWTVINFLDSLKSSFCQVAEEYWQHRSVFFWDYEAFVYITLSMWLYLIVIIIIIERRDYGGLLSEDCEDTEQSFEKVSKVRETVLRTRNCQMRPKLLCT